MTPNLDRDGFAILRDVFADVDCRRIADEVEIAMSQRDGDAIKGTTEKRTSGAGQGRVVGGRNLIHHWDGWRFILERPDVSQFVAAHVGPEAGLVRILYFDKPPGQGWSLAMHQDRTIAVAKHIDPPAPFAKPTRKAGVPHVEGSTRLLQQMLTLRLHIDPMHDDNGPLTVMPGSHMEPNSSQNIETIQCDAGDAFAMRPLLSHGSKAASPTTKDHRRVVHLEIAPTRELPGQYQWHDFVAVPRPASM